MSQNECPDNVYLLDTTQQMIAETDSPRFCLFSPYLFSSGSVSLHSEHIDDGSCARVLNHYGAELLQQNESQKSAFDNPIIIEALKGTAPGHTKVMLSVMNSNATYRKYCDVGRSESFGDRANAVGDEPKAKCVDLNAAAFSAPWCSLGVAGFFSLTIFLLHKIGFVDFAEFISSKDDEMFGALPDASDEENMIDPMQSGIDVQEGQL